MRKVVEGVDLGDHTRARNGIQVELHFRSLSHVFSFMSQTKSLKVRADGRPSGKAEGKRGGHHGIIHTQLFSW